MYEDSDEYYENESYQYDTSIPEYTYDIARMYRKSTDSYLDYQIGVFYPFHQLCQICEDLLPGWEVITAFSSEWA